MVDVHCHILPGVDDGAKSWQVAARMCEMALQDGIELIVATPHANPAFEYDRQHCAELLRELAERVGDSPGLLLGCDFHLSYENISDALGNPHRYTIGETPYLLVEFSDFSIPPAIDDVFRQFVSAGIIPIITHPERNPLLQAQPESVSAWVGLGCVVQVTASALTGDWGRLAKDSAEWLLESRVVHILATDAHGVQWRPPLLSAARGLVSNRHGEGIARALVEDNPRAVVTGKQLPYLPAPETSPAPRSAIRK